MSVNSSSLDVFPYLAPPLLPSNSTSFSMAACFRSRVTVSVFCAVSSSLLLFLPLLLRVLYLGCQQRCRRRSLPLAAAPCDPFTCHAATMQLGEYLGFAVFYGGGYAGLGPLRTAGIYFFTLSSLGQGAFHLLGCVERYLAVVHPATYLGLRRGGGARIRRACVGCVWLLWLASGAVAPQLHPIDAVVFFYCVIFLFLAVLALCSGLVLRVLGRPRPGEAGGGGGTRAPADRSKRRASGVILAVMGVLALRFGGNLLCLALSAKPASSGVCALLISTLWFSLPSNLLTALLFLRRLRTEPGGGATT
ncbi:hypothetical protein EYF80_055189 [Liparis tanakae]|uniref:G-protein coupled receptors family 1 profile domain-containing protein n=1 Tax=Liparis tanakae TaxID=230148 RepID=A0A4Z2F0C3_9TELE|nr:hypothetical protein EYF80_055189 [Liparis tanakae]